jgi:hypothetical protein
MSNLVKTYFLAPNFDIAPPPTGPLFLGSIVTDPRNPSRSLTKENDTTPKTTSIYTSYKEGYSVKRSQMREGKVGIWASFLATILGIGANAEASRNHETDEVYNCDRLETEYFQPDDAYIFQALQVLRVKSYIEKSWFEKPVYMITGLKIARGAIAESGEGKALGWTAKASVDGTSLGIPVSGGPKLEGKIENKEQISWKGSSDFVFAYQVIKIKSKRKDLTFKEEAYNKGALYNDDDDVVKDETTVDGLRSQWKIESLDEEADEEVVLKSIVDEDGLNCFIVVD